MVTSGSTDQKAVEPVADRVAFDEQTGSAADGLNDSLLFSDQTSRNDGSVQLLCMSAFGGRAARNELLAQGAGFVDLSREAVCNRTIVFNPTQLSGVFPRQPLVSFLPAVASAEGVDPRSPKDPSVLPHRVVHVLDERGENFVVEYVDKQLCVDGCMRRKIFYQCKKHSAPSGDDAHKAGHEAAEARAWSHVQRVLDNQDCVANNIAEHGKGPLNGSGWHRFHGYAFEAYHFYCHPKRPDFLKYKVWRLMRDTLHPAHQYCVSAQFVRRLADGTEVFRCKGHDLAGRDVPVVADLPENLQGKPFEGLRLVEVFIGVEGPKEGGAMMSKLFEEAGGTAHRYDQRLDSRMDFLVDDELRRRELESPADLYHIAFPCTHLTVAKMTPTKPRSLDRVYGDESDPMTKYWTRMVRLTARWTLELLQKGACVIIENPLLSYLFMTDEFSYLAGHFDCVWIDHCQEGMPYQKGQIFIANCSAFLEMGRVCNHLMPHPEQLHGVHARRSASYPRSLVERLLGALAVEYKATGRMGRSLAGAFDAALALGTRTTDKGSVFTLA